MSIFWEELAKDLWDIQLKPGVLLKCIDDLLITSNTCQYHLLNTITVLNHLAKPGYKLSPNKTQIYKHEVAYLGFS